MKTHKFYIKGMHCQACVLLTESELQDLPEIQNVKADLKCNTVEINGNFQDKDAQTIVKELSEFLAKHGYSLHLEKPVHSVKWSEFQIAIPVALGFIALFILLQKLNIVNLVGTGEVNYSTAFVIGLIASVSSCMAVVGGLVLSVSANFAKEGDKIRPQVMFHIGRIAAFFLLGGAIGAIGSAFQLKGDGTFVISFIVGLVMILLGLNLLDIFPWAKKLQPTLPKFLSRHVLEIKKVNHVLTPILLGIVTFFLPCGFTQSMQLYALSTGNFWSGAMIMLVFALGTLPVLALLSFSSLSIHDKAKSGIFFKTAGLVVIFFALFNIINSLVAIGILPPIFNF